MKSEFKMFSLYSDTAPLKLGQRVVKVNSEPGDNKKNGAIGTIIDNFFQLGEAYLVIWDGQDLPILVVADKLIHHDPSYMISEDGKSITCLICKIKSYNQNDINDRYCGHCHRFHSNDYA